MCFHIEKCVCVVMTVLALEWIFLNVLGDRIHLVNYSVSKAASERTDFRFREHMLSC